MQKNSITNKITPCCGLPFSVVYWWVSNITLNSESDRQFILSKISQNGTISIDGWKVLVNSGTLEADASLTKAEFLAWFDCNKQPTCEQLKIIIDGFKVGNWTPETELPPNVALIDGVFNGETKIGSVFTKEQVIELMQSGSVFLGNVTNTTDFTSGNSWGFATEGTYQNAENIVIPSGKIGIISKTNNDYHSTIIDIPKQELHSVNLFNKKTFRKNTAFDANHGNEVASNELNGISELIKIDGNKTYGISVWNAVNSPNFPYSQTINLLGLYIAEYDVNGNYLGFKTLSNGDTFYNCIYKPSANVASIKINPNPLTPATLNDISELLIFAEIEKFPITYLEFTKDLQTEIPEKTFSKKILENQVNYLPANGNENVYIFHDSFLISAGLNRIILELWAENAEVIPFIVGGSSFVSIPSLPKNEQPKLKFSKSTKENTFFIEFEHYFDVARYIETDIEVNNKFVQNLTSKVSLKVYKTNIDNNGKPIDFDFGITQAQLNNAISNQVPAIIQQEIGSDLNDYLAENINSFTFLQPNYIQANSGFNLANLNSSMNGKFISVIQDIDLQGQTIDFVAQGVKNLKLVFNGGRILNGKIRSNYTRCVFNSNEAFVNVEILNQFQNYYALPEWFGAKIDGQDGGIGDFTKDDSFAMNQALKFSSVVKLTGSRTMIVKKPIVLRSGNKIEADENFEVKLGMASNCTLIKNEHVDLPNSGKKNGVTYPQGFVRNKNVSIIGGIWNGNAKYQNRQNSTSEYGDNPEVVGTPQFPDADGQPYWGVMMKFADVDFLTLKNLKVKDARTYQILIAGITHYEIDNIYSERSFHLVNQDGIHIHGQCYHGTISNVYGVSGDDLIAVTTMEARDLSVRIGDVIDLKIKNVFEYGIHPNATLANPIEVSAGKPNDYNAFGPLRFSYTDELIDNVIVENVNYNFPNKGCAVIISNVPNANSSSTGQFNHGVGKVGTITFRNISGVKNSARPFGLGNFTKIDKMIVENCDFKNIDNNYNSPLIWDLENFSTDTNPFVNNKIGTLVFRNSFFTKGNSNATEQGLIYSKGKINEVIFDNFIMQETADVNNHIMFLARTNIDVLTIKNSKILVDQIILTNELNTIFESGNTFANSNIGINPTQRANTEKLTIGANPSNPVFGDRILKSDGIYLFTTAWNKL